MADREIPKGCAAVPISKAEVAVRADELAATVKQIAQLDEEWATVKQQHGKKLTGLEEKMKRLADDVRTRTEIRDAQGNLWDADTLRGAVVDEEDDGEEPGEKASNGTNGHGADAGVCTCHHSMAAHVDENAEVGACRSDGCTCTEFKAPAQPASKKRKSKKGAAQTWGP